GCHQWLALGLGHDPQALLSDAERTRLAALGAVFAAWNAPHVGPGTASLTTEDPAFLAWMRRSRASAVLVRPDRLIPAARQGDTVHFRGVGENPVIYSVTRADRPAFLSLGLSVPDRASLLALAAESGATPAPFTGP